MSCACCCGVCERENSEWLLPSLSTPVVQTTCAHGQVLAYLVACSPAHSSQPHAMLGTAACTHTHTSYS